MNSSEELFLLAEGLDTAASKCDLEEVSAPLNVLKGAAHQVERSFCGSWLGYHSRVYYEGLKPPPAGANFSKEWGLKDLSFTSLGSVGDWQEYQFEQVSECIIQIAGNPDLTPARKAARSADKVFSDSKAEIDSILQTELTGKSDPFLSGLLTKIQQIEPLGKTQIASDWSPKGQFVCRDMVALGQGTLVPPHIDVLAEIASIGHSFGMCRAAADIARKAASHIERRKRNKAVSSRIGTNVFIGHGRSSVWRELKDFVQDRLALPWDEFNRVPVAGVTNISRLSQMLDAAAIALLVMTAEDELLDGEVQARMNVVHEAGLFQGRLGFSRAIILLEDGCAEFSNIQGLGQIRFPKGNIAASFEEVRRVLEREGLVDT
jgi:predicted nucleotide-binding protein